MGEELVVAVLLGREEELVDLVAVAPVEVGDGAPLELARNLPQLLANVGEERAAPQELVDLVLPPQVRLVLERVVGDLLPRVDVRFGLWRCGSVSEMRGKKRGGRERRRTQEKNE